MAPDIRPLSAVLQKKAIEELNEDPQRIEEDINALRDWINKQSHLKARTSDQFLVAFLRGCKYSLEKAKQKIEKYYTLRAGIPEVFKDRNLDNPKILEIIRTGVALRLPIPLGEDGPCISIIRVASYDISKYSFPEIIKVGMMIGDIQLLEDDNSVVSGLVEIMDMTNVGLGNLFQLNPSFLAKCSQFSDDAMPMRHKGIHFICTIPQFETAFSTIKSLMGNKDNRKVQIHGSDMESLHKVIPKKYLPVEYGGENGSIESIIDHWEKKLISYQKYFLEEEEYGCDEHFKSADRVDFETVFGVEGSFRKLAVD